MKKQTVFISGIAGFLGSHLADLMLGLGHRVVGCDNLCGGDLENVPVNAEFFEADTNNLQKMKEITRHADVVIHTAATAYDGLSVFSPYMITQNVHANTVSLLTAAIDNNVKRFVFCSSMARYGHQEVPFTENLEPHPQTPYGVAKVAAEMAIQNLCKLHRKEFVISVPHNIIGPRQKYDDPFRNVAAIMINRMIQGQQPVIYGDGNQKRCFSFVKDTLQVFEQLVFSEQAAGQVVNVGPDEEFVTIIELAETIAEILKFDLDPMYVPGRPAEGAFANCSANKARDLFGYETQFSLRQGLKEMIDWIKDKGPKPFNYHMDIEIQNELVPRTWREEIF